MHQKIVIIDEKTVLLGSLNVLSQSRTREVMLVMHGAYFARKLLEDERAADFSAPPRCAACRGTKIDLRRSNKTGTGTGGATTEAVPAGHRGIENPGPSSSVAECNPPRAVGDDSESWNLRSVLLSCLNAAFSATVVSLAVV
jgi:hypothetical protein